MIFFIGNFSKSKEGLEIKANSQIPRYNFIVEKTHWEDRRTKVTSMLSLGGKVNSVFFFFLSLFFFSRFYIMSMYFLYSQGKFYLKNKKKKTWWPKLEIHSLRESFSFIPWQWLGFRCWCQTVAPSFENQWGRTLGHLSKRDLGYYPLVLHY